MTTLATVMAAFTAVMFVTVMALFTVLMLVGLLLPPLTCPELPLTPITLPPFPLSVPFDINRTRFNIDRPWLDIYRPRLNIDRLWFHVGRLGLDIYGPGFYINGGLVEARDANIDIDINASRHGRNSRHHQRSGSHDASGPIQILFHFDSGYICILQRASPIESRTETVSNVTKCFSVATPRR
jgi:hypothetical protein